MCLHVIITYYTYNRIRKSDVVTPFSINEVCILHGCDWLIKPILLNVYDVIQLFYINFIKKDKYKESYHEFIGVKNHEKLTL